MLFRDMNLIAEKKVNQRIEIRDQARDLLEADPASLSEKLAVTSIKALPISKQHSLSLNHDIPSTKIRFKRKPWQDVVIDRFFADYAVHTDAFLENLDFLPGICNGPDNCSYVEDALLATALVSQSNQLKVDWMSMKAAKHYGRALLSLADALKDPKEAKNDTVLVAMFLVSLYEAVSGHRPSGLLFDLNHFIGRSSVLRLRGIELLKTHVERSLFHITFCQMMYNCISRNEQPPLEAESWLEQFPEHIHFQLVKCHLRTARLGADAHKIFAHYTGESSSVISLLQILKKAIAIELDYQDWYEAATGPYKFRQVRRASQSVDSSSMKAPSFCRHSYKDIWVAHIWNAFRGSRIHLHEVLLHTIDLICAHASATLLSDDLYKTTLQSRSIVDEMVTDICASISFSIGSADSAAASPASEGVVPLGGYFLIWPLHVAINSCEIGSVMELFMKEKLRYISDVLGIKVCGLACLRIKKFSWDLS